MRVLYAVILCVCWYGSADGGDAPFIKPCRSSDSVCLKSSAQAAIPILAAGVPSLGISVLDPMNVERVSTSQAGLDVDFRNTLVKGLRNCKVEVLKLKENKTYLDLLCSVIMTGNYTLDGQLLIFPIQGNGRYKIKIRDILVKIVYDISERTVNGEKYWRLQNWTHTADVKTGVEFNFHNLFNGNEQLASTVQNFANEHWKEIFQEVAPPIVKAIVDNIIGETMKIFEKVPVKQLALP